MYQICVSGAAKGDSVEEGKLLAKKVGASIARAKHTLLTGATSGLPDYSAKGYKAAGGMMSLGISPASSKVEHILKYRLPIKSYDSILYTGLHYVGRDALLINSSDAVVSIGGRIGTLHESTIALETDTPIGFIQGAGGISTEIMDILHAAERRISRQVVFSEDPDDLISQLTQILDEKNQRYLHLYR